MWRTKHLDTKVLEVADTLQVTKLFENYCSSDTQDGLNTHFHDAQWVRKHWDLDMDFDTESEEDEKDMGFLVEDWSEESQEPSKETQQAQGVLDGDEDAGDHPKMGELAMPSRWSSCLTFSKIYFSPGWRWT